MVQKSTAPYKGPPSWLDASFELQIPKRKKKSEMTDAEKQTFIAEFIKKCVIAFLANECNLTQALEGTANCIVETGWGFSVIHNNAGGWKITKQYAEGYERKHGKKPNWWKARGNVKSADSDWCFYRAFDSLDLFIKEWIEHFVPNPMNDPKYPKYKKAGDAFWDNDEDWFAELILAGYKGAPSRKKLMDLRGGSRPDYHHDSIKGHRDIFEKCKKIIAQMVIGATPDGAWGNKSKELCKKYQQIKKITETGEIDEATMKEIEKDLKVKP